jgi:hypothetical protein
MSHYWPRTCKAGSLGLLALLDLPRISSVGNVPILEQFMSRLRLDEWRELCPSRLGQQGWLGRCVPFSLASLDPLGMQGAPWGLPLLGET